MAHAADSYRSSKVGCRLIEIPFGPFLELGPVRVAWHSLWSFIGLVAGATLSFRCARWLVKDERVYPYALAVVVGGLAGARAFHVIDNWAHYATRPAEIFAFWTGGIAVIGAPIGSAIAGWLVARRLRLPVGFMFDVSAIGITLGLALGRVGDVMIGEHHAIACTGLPWCVRYTHPDSPGQAQAVHPVVAYDLLWDVVILAALLFYWRRVRGRPPESRIFWLYLLLYGAGRAISSVLRLDPVHVAGLQTAQLTGIIYVAAGAVALFVLERRDRLAFGRHPATTRE